MPDDHRVRPDRPRVTAGALPALVVFAAAAILVVLSVAVGPIDVTTPSWLDSDLDAGEAPEATPMPMPSISNLPTQQPFADRGEGRLLSWTVALVIAVILALIILYLVYRRLPRWRGLTRSSKIVGGEIDDTADELRQAAEEASASLAHDAGPTDEAIIAAWLRLEVAAAAVGDTRLPHQTPSEFTAALLRHHNADPSAVQELLDLYERARFSTVPDISAADVAAARTALATIMQTMETVAPVSDAR